ncbi:MAG: CoA-transferase [Thermoplasmata archaeon]|nr:CoA-transferase [Thermoplasmata archaeon]
MIIYKKEDLLQLLSSIEDKSVIAISGFNNSTTPLYLIYSLWDAYKKYGHPKNLFIEMDAFPGVPGTGLDIIGKNIYENDDREFISGMLIPYLYRSEYLQKLTKMEYFETYSFSIGITTNLFREMAAGRPGLLSKIGLGTFHDPRLDDSAMNEKARNAKRCYAKIIDLEEPHLLYRAPKPKYSFIRATSSDPKGNLSVEHEGIYGTILPIAMSSKAQPDSGKVFAQVKYIVKENSRNPKNIHVPGPLVDYVIPSEEEFNIQGSTIKYDPAISGELIPNEIKISKLNEKLDDRMVIKRRLVLEIIKMLNSLKRPAIMNFGTGIPSESTSIIAEEGYSDSVYTTVESGPWGGIALSGNDFGLSYGPFAIIPQADQFYIYEGGIADAASLGFLQVDEYGNVNPSFIDNKLPGPGGFPDISNGVPRIFFAGGFTGGKRLIYVDNKKLKIEKDGNVIKFVKNVEKIFFSGSFAIKNKKEVVYITERAVFRLSEKGLILEEIAPGIDIDNDILEKMDFKPIINDLKIMDERIFMKNLMKL